MNKKNKKKQTNLKKTDYEATAWWRWSLAVIGGVQRGKLVVAGFALKWQGRKQKSGNVFVSRVWFFSLKMAIFF